MTENKRLSKTPSIRRLPIYLARLKEYRARGLLIVTSSDLAEDMNTLPIVVKKDLQLVAAVAKKRSGYQIEGTIDAICRFLNWDLNQTAILIGVGNLGTALLGYNGFAGLTFLAGFDNNPQKIGTLASQTPIYSIDSIQKFAQNNTIDIAVLTTPANIAQEMADILIAANIKAIWNFTPAKLKVPPHVALQREDLSAGFAELSAKIKYKKNTIGE